MVLVGCLCANGHFVVCWQCGCVPQGFLCTVSAAGSSAGCCALLLALGLCVSAWWGGLGRCLTPCLEPHGLLNVCCLGCCKVSLFSAALGFQAGSQDSMSRVARANPSLSRPGTQHKSQQQHVGNGGPQHVHRSRAPTTKERPEHKTHCQISRKPQQPHTSNSPQTNTQTPHTTDAARPITQHRHTGQILMNIIQPNPTPQQRCPAARASNTSQLPLKTTKTAAS